jgi:transposase-like protein
MSTHVASFRDYQPGHLKRRIEQTTVEPRAETILSDMSDGNLVTEFFFSFAGFTYAGSSLVLTIIGILGDNPDGIKLFDDDIAKIASCNERTVRRWRKAYLNEAKGTEEKKGTNFYPLEIIEGEYNHAKERYEKTLYRITFAEPLEQAVAAARARSDYQTDRLHALEEAALFHYEDIPQAPPPGRKRKPARAIQTPLANLNRAAKKITAAQTLLREMSPHQRAAQGKDMRTALDAIRQQMEEFEALLSGAFTTVEKEEVKDIQDKMSGIPPPPPLTPVPVVSA